MPYLLQRKAESTGAKIALILVGILLGLMLIPLFIVAAVLWTLFALVMELLDLCGCAECDCFSFTAGGNYYNHNRSVHLQEQNDRAMR
mmetsp:Transcript_9243/g.10899  ORF Transcript_9243/g.10899 Transcript_9243/m.10899 type:complete len:88 (+) Transcript_9243:963-1226(+)